VHDHVLIFGTFDAHTQSLQSTQRSQAIFAGQESSDVSNTLGDSAQHQSAVGDRFVARNRQLTCGRAARACAIFRHIQSTARG
jgi:hypothetical protein